MKRILHIALGRENPEMEDALASMGGYRIIDWTTEQDINAKILEVVREFRPNLTFMQLQGKDIVSLDTMNQLRFSNIFTVNWTGDVREDIEWYKDYAVYFDNTLFTNETDVKALKAEGLLAGFLPVGFQDRIYNNKPNGNFVHGGDIVFMANNYEGRFPMSEFRKDIADFLRGIYSGDFCLYGTGWGLYNVSLNSRPQDEAAIYRSAKIGISISHFDYERYYSDRMLRIMACGCFCLSYHYKGIEKDFKIGEHLDTFKSEEELKDKIDYYLGHESVRKKIAEAGHDLVWNTCRWPHRIADLKNIIGW